MQIQAGTRILLVEDEVLIAMDMQDMLLDIGAQNVFVVHTIYKALEMLEVEKFHVAVLDVMLQGNPATAVADQLTEKAIPFCFASGYTAHSLQLTLPVRFHHVPVLDKPFSQNSLVACLTPLLTPYLKP